MNFKVRFEVSWPSFYFNLRNKLIDFIFACASSFSFFIVCFIHTFINSKRYLVLPVWIKSSCQIHFVWCIPTNKWVSWPFFNVHYLFSVLMKLLVKICETLVITLLSLKIFIFVYFSRILFKPVWKFDNISHINISFSCFIVIERSWITIISILNYILKLINT